MMAIITFCREWESEWDLHEWVGEWTFSSPISGSNSSSASVACCHGSYFLQSVAITLSLVYFHVQVLIVFCVYLVTVILRCYTPYTYALFVILLFLVLSTPDSCFVTPLHPNTNFHSHSILTSYYTLFFIPVALPSTLSHTGIPSHSISRSSHASLHPFTVPFPLYTWLTFFTPFYTLLLPSTPLSHASIHPQVLQLYSLSSCHPSKHFSHMYCSWLEQDWWFMFPEQTKDDLRVTGTGIQITSHELRVIRGKKY